MPPSVTTSAEPSTAPSTPRASVAIGKWVALSTVAIVAAALLLERTAVGDPAFHWRALALALAGAALLLRLAPKHLATFGAANRVTLARGALTLLLLALVGVDADARAAWVVVAVATLAAVLDAVDGRLARERGESSAFGARFDMETDALLILTLALLAWQFGKAGPWIVLAGALRYVFVAAAYALPWLDRPLPPSRRRQTVCVVQIVSLIACIAPLFAVPLATVIAALGLAALVGSFAVDVVWLARRAAHG